MDVMKVERTAAWRGANGEPSLAPSARGLSEQEPWKVEVSWRPSLGGHGCGRLSPEITEGARFREPKEEDAAIDAARPVEQVHLMAGGLRAEDEMAEHEFSLEEMEPPRSAGCSDVDVLLNLGELVQGVLLAAGLPTEREDAATDAAKPVQQVRLATGGLRPEDVATGAARTVQQVRLMAGGLGTEDVAIGVARPGQQVHFVPGGLGTEDVAIGAVGPVQPVHLVAGGLGAEDVAIGAAGAVQQARLVAGGLGAEDDAIGAAWPVQQSRLVAGGLGMEDVAIGTARPAQQVHLLAGGLRAEELLALSEEELLALVPRGEDGEPLSVGSLAHDGEGRCKPCIFARQDSCLRGVRCMYCHAPHEARKKPLRPSKKTRKKMRRRSAVQFLFQPPDEAIQDLVLL